MNHSLMFYLIIMVSVVALAPAAASYAYAVPTPSDSVTPVKHQYMVSRLADLYDAYLAVGGASTSAAQQGIAPMPVSGDGQTVRVVIEMDTAGAPAPAGLGIEVEVTYGNLIQATVPTRNLDVVSSAEGVALVRLPFAPILPEDLAAATLSTTTTAPTKAAPLGAHPARGTDATVSQGALIIGADLMNRAGHTGQGVKVAVIDIGFDITNPEISDNIVEYESFWFGHTIAGASPAHARHGTAIAEIIVDVAPDAELYLYTIGTDAEFFHIVDEIIARGDIDIVSMALGWDNHAGPRDGTNALAKKVAEARDSGILWVNIAGNRADKHWSGQFSDPDGDGYHNFAADDQSINVDVEAGELVLAALTWDDWDSPSQDFDLYLYDKDGTLLDRSINYQAGGVAPYEWVYGFFRHNTTVHLVIQNYSADRDVNFHLIGTHVLAEYAVPASSITAPANSPGSFTVGAYNSTDDTLEAYSSRGPTLDGRIKPDISAPTDVDTSAYHPESFGATSAAAPHVAGAAAVLMQKFPGATAGDVQGMLERTTINYHPKSNDDGTGRVDLSMFVGSDVLILDPGNPECASDGSCFFPGTVSVDPGESVTWVNAYDMPVRIAGSGQAAFDSGPLSRGETYSVTFAAEGAFEYGDPVRPWASGRIVVGSGAPADPPAAPTAMVTGTVFSDADRDGARGTAEPGLADVDVLVYDYVAGAGSYSRTGSAGGYAVAGVQSSQTALVQVELPLPPGHLPLGGTAGLFAYTPLLAAGSVTTVDFPLYPVLPDQRGTVVFEVYDDRNSNGIRDAGEPGVPGATVSTRVLLTHESDVRVTGPDGSATHSGLVPDVVLATIIYADPATSALLLPDGFTRITTANGGYEHVDVAPGGTNTVRIGLGR